MEIPETMKESIKKHANSEQSFNYNTLAYKQQKVNWYNEMQGTLEGYNCEECKNKGYIKFLEDGYEWSRECKCMETRKSLTFIDASGLKDLLNKYTFNNYIASSKWQKDIKETALKFTGTCNKWFYIGGQPGSGKTHICTAICAKMLRKGSFVKYMLWRDESIKLRSKINDREYQNEIIQFKNAKVLYIDDLFKTEKGIKPTTAEINLAFEILNYRYNRGAMTIISSELSVADIIKIDEGTGSRIFDRSKDFNRFIGFDETKNYRYKSDSAEPMKFEEG